MSTIPFSYEIPGGHGLDCVETKGFGVDASHLTATGILAAASLDRVGEVVNIAGIKTGKHQKNPVALWLHGMGRTAGPEADMPIGVYEVNGIYTVELLPNDGIVRATTKFHQRTQLAEQTFALVDEGIIRGQSIGYRELKTEPIYANNRQVGRYLEEIELVEGSWVPIPMNGDAVRRALSKDQICGKSLAEPIRRALLPFAAKAPIWANGFTFEGKPMPTKTKAETPADEVTGAQNSTVQTEEPQEPHGAKFARGLHAKMGEISSMIEQDGGLLDHPEIKAYCKEFSKGFGKSVKALVKSFAKWYPNLKPLAEQKADEAEDDDETVDLEEKAEAEGESESDSDIIGDVVDDDSEDDDSEDDDQNAEAEKRLKDLETKIAHQKRLLKAQTRS